jgi:hypothetical protein
MEKLKVLSGKIGGNAKTKEKDFIRVSSKGIDIMKIDNIDYFYDEIKGINMPAITIYDENGNKIFEGTHEQLIQLINK